jgi:hypothetical protein
MYLEKGRMALSVEGVIYCSGLQDCSNYRGIPLLLTSSKMLSNILLSRLNPYVDENIVDHQCGF